MLTGGNHSGFVKAFKVVLKSPSNSQDVGTHYQTLADNWPSLSYFTWIVTTQKWTGFFIDYKCDSSLSTYNSPNTFMYIISFELPWEMQ